MPDDDGGFSHDGLAAHRSSTRHPARPGAVLAIAGGARIIAVSGQAWTRMSLVFIGDIHQNWHHVEAGLASLPAPPRAAVLLGDIECTAPLDHVAAPLLDRGVAVYWIHGNHEHDSGPEMWANLVAPERNPLTAAGALHSRVVEIEGVRVAGLGGTFLPHVWAGNAPPRLHRRDQLAADLAASRPDLSPAQAARVMHFLATTAIWPEDVEALAAQTADVLVTHDAPSSHPEGSVALDRLARRMGVGLIVHGHHHITSHAQAADGLRVLAVGAAWAVGLDGAVTWRGGKRERPLPRPGEGWAVQPVAA
jgi:predicted phosphodiesterase